MYRFCILFGSRSVYLFLFALLRWLCTSTASLHFYFLLLHYIFFYSCSLLSSFLFRSRSYMLQSTWIIPSFLHVFNIFLHFAQNNHISSNKSPIYSLVLILMSILLMSFLTILIIILFPFMLFYFQSFVLFIRVFGIVNLVRDKFIILFISLFRKNSLSFFASRILFS